jgi:hypothetical protein
MPKIVIVQRRRHYGIVEPPEIGGWMALEKVSLIDCNTREKTSGYLGALDDYNDLMGFVACHGADREATLRVDAYDSADGNATYPVLSIIETGNAR